MSVPPWRANKMLPRKDLNKGNSKKTNTNDSRNPTKKAVETSPDQTHNQNQDQKDMYQWPDSLKSFVERSLSQVTPDNKSELELQLRAKITEAFETQTTWTIDWDKEVLPVLRKSVPTKKQKPEKKKPQKRVAVEDENGVPVASGNQIEKRQKRFEREHTFEKNYRANQALTKDASPYPDIPTGPVVGRSTALEKKYLRLTSEPDPDNVRPEAVLKQTLELLKNKWKKEQNYSYICDQFKSMRQDLTVQHIENKFTVQVYEIHARIALEKHDLGEYNQCQSRLRELYSKKIEGHQNEFLAYRILYLLHTHARAEIAQMLLEMPVQQLDDSNIKHALDVNKAVMNNNFAWLFTLYVNAPNMGGYVMDNFVPRLRLLAMTHICKAFRPEITLQYMFSQLGFNDEGEAIDFLTRHKVDDKVVLKDGSKLTLQTKESYGILELARQQAFKKVDIKGQI